MYGDALRLPLLFISPQRFKVIAIHPGDELEGDFLWTNRFARTHNGAVPEAFFVHLLDHIENPPVFLRLTLWQDVQMFDWQQQCQISNVKW